ncbi:hypothetical protein H9X77_13135, partial [Clostridium saudiense]|nr:hypothetical protein [Clostridium saudiense]
MENRFNGLSECEFLKELFDKVRIINPLKNEIVDLPHEGTSWMRKGMCENCVSMRAFNEDKNLWIGTDG